MSVNPVYTDVCWNRGDLITVVWAANNRIQGQRMDSLGNRIGNIFWVNDDTLITGESFPAIKPDLTGNFLITWTGIYQGQNVYARLFDTAAVPLTGTVQLDAAQMDTSGRSDIALQDSIWFVVFQNGLGGGVYLQCLDNRGVLVGGNRRVSEPVGSRNYWPKISALGDNYIITWARRFFNNIYDIMGQMIVSDGSLIGSNFVMSDDKGGAPQYWGAVAADTSGNFFIVWDDFRSLDSIYHYPNQFGKLFHPDGQPFHWDTIIGQLSGGQFSAIAINDLGLYVSVWSRVNAADSLHQVFGQRFDRNGVFLGSNFQISASPPYTGLGINRIYALQNNHFVVIWNEIRPDSDYIRIYGRFLDPLGIPYGNEFVISLDSTAHNESYSLVDEGNGRFIMCVARGIDTVNITIQEFDYSANPVSGPVVLNETPTLTNYFAGAKGLRRYLFAWIAQSGHIISGQMVDTNLQMIGNNFRISDDSISVKDFPRMVSNVQGMYLVVWQQDHVYGQFYDSLGTRIGNNFMVDNDTTGAEQWLPDVYSKNNRIYFTWSDTRKLAHWYDIYCKVMEWPTLPYAGENRRQNYAYVLSIAPNPFRTRTDIRLQIPDDREKTASLKIYDAAGRLVKSFLCITGYPANRLVWNGADDNGRIAPAGVYFVDLVMSGTRQIRKIIKIH